MLFRFVSNYNRDRSNKQTRTNVSSVIITSSKFSYEIVHIK
jgi:hypothetical protein